MAHSRARAAAGHALKRAFLTTTANLAFALFFKAAHRCAATRGHESASASTRRVSRTNAPQHLFSRYLIPHERALRWGDLTSADQRARRYLVNMVTAAPRLAPPPVVQQPGMPAKTTWRQTNGHGDTGETGGTRNGCAAARVHCETPGHAQAACCAT